MAIDQCADDSPAIRVTEQSDGSMRWDFFPADGSLGISAAGAYVSTGRGVYKDGFGKPAWIAEWAGRFRSSAGLHTDLTVANNGIILQELVGNITNTKAQPRDVLVIYSFPWVDIVDNGNPGSAVSMQYSAGVGAKGGYLEAGQMLTDWTGWVGLRRTRVPGSTVVEAFSIPPGQTYVLAMRIVPSCAYGTGSYSPFTPGMRLDALWLGSSS